jgi:hypothetical protein
MKQASAERCREQAVLHRRMAEGAEDPELREKLLRIAASYEEVAEHILQMKQHHAGDYDSRDRTLGSGE